jgi:hypothetical protein
MAASSSSDIPDSKSDYCPCNRCKQARKEGRHEENVRITEILRDRYEDLLSCTKDDGCKELARIVKVCMEDINHD